MPYREKSRGTKNVAHKIFYKKPLKEYFVKIKPYEDTRHRK